ncbi:hypothetical protein AB0J83_46390 [Actinoplanes sp. NPDC049596]|uniref:hypothetical protein n=1 Tax=unclassified Actinoplanes TaxID=2626549 RepID=UPI0034450C00
MLSLVDPLIALLPCVGDYLTLDPLVDLAATPAAVAQIGLNVVLFVPLGFLLRYRFGRGVRSATAAGLIRCPPGRPTWTGPASPGVAWPCLAAGRASAGGGPYCLGVDRGGGDRSVGAPAP